jgi:hypothetical protein
MTNESTAEAGAAGVAEKVAVRHEAMLRQAAQEAQYLFTEPVAVTGDDRLHGVSGIIEKKLLEANMLDTSTPAHKKNHMIDFLVNELRALSPGELTKLGFTSGNVDVIRTGDVLDLSLLDKNGWVQAIR